MYFKCERNPYPSGASRRTPVHPRRDGTTLYDRFLQFGSSLDPAASVRPHLTPPRYILFRQIVLSSNVYVY